MNTTEIYLIITLLLITYTLDLIRRLVIPREYQLFSLGKMNLEKLEGVKERVDKIGPPISINQNGMLEKIGKKVEKERYKRKFRNKKKRMKIPQINEVEKKIGKPIGGRGGGRKRPTCIDRKETVSYKKCPVCGESFAGRKPRITYTRCVTDMIFQEKGLHAENTEYTIIGHRCNNCNTDRIPSIKARKGGRFGYGMMTYVLIKRIGHRLSYDIIVKDLHDFHNESITKPTLINWIKKTVKPVEKLYKELWKRALKSNSLYVDETGLPMNGNNWWMWVLVTKNIAIYHVNKSRGHDAIKQELEEFQGVIISDFWTAYNKLSQEQQKCLAHLIRKLEEILWDRQKAKEKLYEKLRIEEERRQYQENELKPGGKKRGRKRKFPDTLSSKEVKQIKSDISQINNALWQCLLILQFFTSLIHIYNETRKEETSHSQKEKVNLPSENEAQGQLDNIIFLIEKMGIEDPDVIRIIKRLKKFKDSLFTFLKYDDVLPNNNPAERALRPFVVQRKISGSFKNEENINSYAIHLSIKETCEMNNINYKSALISCLYDNWKEVLVQIPI